MPEAISRQEQLALDRVLMRVREQGLGVAIGLLLGLGLFAATNILVLRGGQPIGPHLGLLSVYFPGYRVTFLGSFIGFVYAFVVGYGIGRTIGAVYNRLAGT
jgi:hypothetical protein